MDEIEPFSLICYFLLFRKCFTQGYSSFLKNDGSCLCSKSGLVHSVPLALDFVHSSAGFFENISAGSEKRGGAQRRDVGGRQKRGIKIPVNYVNPKNAGPHPSMLEGSRE